jgi:hypothetical protein
MGYPKRLLRTNLTLICLLGVSIAVALAAPKVTLKRADDYGFVYAKEHGFADQQSLMVTAIGRERVFSYDVASRVGGVILQAVAEPDPSSGKVSMTYDPASQDGHRFKINIGDEAGEILALDWELVPLIRFVDSGQTAAMTLLGEPKNQAERMSSSFFSRTMFIEIHPAFRDTVLGNNFIFTDAMLVDGSPGDIRDVTESFSEPIPGYSDLATFNETKSEQAAERIEDELSEGGWNTYIFTDVDVKFSFFIRDHRLKMTGEPYYAFLSNDFETKTTEINDRLTEMFRHSGLIQDLNPKIYELDRTSFQLAAVLRKLKATDTEKWEALLKAIPAGSPEPSMDTPRAWKP